MKLFDDFEAVRFPEEDLIFITKHSYLYYIYEPEDRFWRKYRRAGHDRITVGNYQEVSREEITEALGGIFPSKETDFMRLCNPEQLWTRDMRDLLEEDYPKYMSDWTIRDTVLGFLLESNICHTSYLKLRELFDDAVKLRKDNAQILDAVRKLSFAVIGRDIFKKEIRIVDGHDYSSYFWIMPVRVIDYADSDHWDNVAEMRSCEISIEENDVAQYLTPFLDKYFDGDLAANRNRVQDRWTDDNGNEQTTYISGFVWNLTHNYYTYEAMRNVIRDIKDTVDALSSGRENGFTAELRKKRGWATYELLYSKNLSKEQVKEYNANRPKEDDTEIELIVDFYRRFVYRMEYMMKVGEENGYDLISFKGP